MILIRGGCRISSYGGRTYKNWAEQREAQICFGVFRVKITILCQKNHIFSIFLGGGGGGALNVAILTCFESMSCDRFFLELRGIVYSILLVQSVFNCRCYVLQPSWFNTISISVICQLD